MLAAILTPFRHSEASRLAWIFAVVYFAQGMWYLPNLSITFLLKDRFGLGAGQTATFFLVTTIPWLLKPLYGLISDFLPLFGRRRQSYFVLTTGLAVAMGLTLAGTGSYSYWTLAVLFTTMGLGLAFTDVLIDAMMVENGQRLGLTGPFQSIQWAALSLSAILVGIGGGWLAQHQPLQLTFLISSVFPAVSLAMGLWALREPRGADPERQFKETWVAIRQALGSRPLWIVAGFIFFYTFSPSFGPALIYYSTDKLGFSKMFIGTLDSLTYASGIVGAALYFAYSKLVSMRQLIHFAIAAAVMATLAYLGYVGQVSAIVIALAFGAVGMVIQLTFLDLAARACPRQAEATFFALLMSVYNGGVQLSQIVGGWLYDWIGFTPLIFIAAGFTALCWLIVPALRLEQFERAPVAEHAGAATPYSSPVEAE
jgi:MFS family permease